jgi:pyrrolidone-carboxylate peptidase
MDSMHATRRKTLQIDVGLLHVPLFDEAILVLDNYVGLMLLHLVDALEVDGTVAMQKSMLLLTWNGLTIIDVVVVDW